MFTNQSYNIFPNKILTEKGSLRVLYSITNLLNTTFNLSGMELYKA